MGQEELGFVPDRIRHKKKCARPITLLALTKRGAPLIMDHKVIEEGTGAINPDNPKFLSHHVFLTPAHYIQCVIREDPEFAGNERLVDYISFVTSMTEGADIIYLRELIRENPQWMLRDAWQAQELMRLQCIHCFPMDPPEPQVPETDDESEGSN